MSNIYKILIILLSIYSVSATAFTNTTLGQVGDEIITTRDVEVHYMLVHSLYHYKSKPQSLPLKEKILSKEISNYMLEEMVFQEAEKFSLVKLSKKEIMKQSTKVLSRILRSPNAKVWKRWKVETDELDHFIKRNLSARKLISAKRKSAEALVSKEEVDNYLKGNAIQGKDQKNEMYRQTVRTFLGRKQGEQRLREWFKVLKEKYKVRVF